MCQAYRRQYGCDFISVMPTNLYGPNDNYDLQNSHVLPALIRKFYEAKRKEIDTVEIWGTGKPLREFLHVDDLADACAFLFGIQNPPDWINVGMGSDVTIKELTETISAVIGFKGKIVWDVDTARDFETVNGVKGAGGSVDGPGPVVVNGILYVNSGYGLLGGAPGNVLLAFSVEGK